MKILHRLLTDAPLISDGAFAALLELNNHPLDPALAEHASVKKMREGMKPKMEMCGNLAIVPIIGALARKPDVFEMFYLGIEDSAACLEMLQQAESDKAVAGILVDFDSPGGFYTGGPEIAEAIRNCKKPIVAWTGGDCCSLAYWMASQADQLYASRSARVGSIGAYTTFTDYSRMLANNGVSVEVIKNKEADYKAVGIVGTALTDAQREHLQQQIQSSFDEFKTDVKASRPRIKDDAMKGQTFNGIQALEAGLIDGISSREAALAMLEKNTK